jgi:hypothetical protein
VAAERGELKRNLAAHYEALAEYTRAKTALIQD